MNCPFCHNPPSYEIVYYYCSCSPKIKFINENRYFFQKKIDNGEVYYEYMLNNVFTFIFIKDREHGEQNRQVFYNVSFSSSKEFINFGDRILNLLLFI